MLENPETVKSFIISIIQLTWFLNSIFCIVIGAFWIRERFRISHHVPGMKILLDGLEDLFLIFPWLFLILEKRAIASNTCFLLFQVTLLSYNIYMVWSQFRELRIVQSKKRIISGHQSRQSKSN